MSISGCRRTSVKYEITWLRFGGLQPTLRVFSTTSSQRSREARTNDKPDSELLQLCNEFMRTPSCCSGIATGSRGKFLPQPTAPACVGRGHPDLQADDGCRPANGGPGCGRDAGRWDAALRGPGTGLIWAVCGRFWTRSRAFPGRSGRFGGVWQGKTRPMAGTGAALLPPGSREPPQARQGCVKLPKLGAFLGSCRLGHKAPPTASGMGTPRHTRPRRNPSPSYSSA